MTSILRNKIIRVLKILLTLDDIDIIKMTIESLLEELEEEKIKKSSPNK